LEQGFTFRERPGGSAGGGPLRLEMRVRGTLRGTVGEQGRVVHFADEAGARRVDYGGLVVTDALGRRLAARFEVAPDRVRMVMDDSGAVYPLTVDPLAQQAYVKASNTGAGDWFGYAVAASGDTVVVGAPLESSAATGVNGNQASNSATAAGAVYVFVRNGSAWTQQAYLKASNTGAHDHFGWAVALDGDLVVVGAEGEDGAATVVNGTVTDTAPEAGAAYVFGRTGTAWSQQAYLKASNTETLDHFGYSVAMNGTTVVVGAYGEDSAATGVGGNGADNSVAEAGAAYVFFKNGSVWGQQGYLKASNPGAGDAFGVAVATAGSDVLVGAYLEDSSTTSPNELAADSGAVYGYRRTSGVWTISSYNKASNIGAGDGFGRTLAMSGGTVVVGAPGEDSNATGVNGAQANDGGPGTGAAYVLTHNTTTTFSQQAYLKASRPTAGFGDAVAVDVDTVVVGALGDTGSAGAAWVFGRVGTVWSSTQTLTAANAEAGDRFGQAVAVSGVTVVGGSYLEDSSATGVGGAAADNSAADAGAVYVMAPPGVDVTVDSVPTGARFSVSGTGCSPGTNYAAPRVLTWAQAVTCGVSLAIVQPFGNAGTQWVFDQWNDGTATTGRSIVAPAQPTTYTATFRPRYLVTLQAVGAGTVSPAGSAYYDPAAVVNVTATAGECSVFLGWNGPVTPVQPSNAQVASGQVTVAGPSEVTAMFSQAAQGMWVDAGSIQVVRGSNPRRWRQVYTVLNGSDGVADVAVMLPAALPAGVTVAAPAVPTGVNTRCTGLPLTAYYAVRNVVPGARAQFVFEYETGQAANVAAIRDGLLGVIGTLP
jgi:hypothetical protein